MAASIKWTPAVISTLRTLWGEGVSTAAIGVRMGISKNAFVGKVHRLNLPAPPSPIRSRSDTPKRERVHRIAVRLTTYPPLPPPAALVPAPAPFSVALAKAATSPVQPMMPAREPVSLKGETDGRRGDSEGCCWPIGEPGRPGFGFCGAPVVRRGPYCEEHYGTAYFVRPDRRHALTEAADVAA